MESVMFDSAPITLPRILASHQSPNHIRNMLDGISSSNTSLTSSSSSFSSSSSSRPRSGSFNAPRLTTGLHPAHNNNNNNNTGSFTRISPLAASSHTDPTALAPPRPTTTTNNTTTTSGKNEVRPRRAVTELVPLRGSMQELREAHDRQYKLNQEMSSPSPCPSTTSSCSNTAPHSMCTLASLPPGARDTILAGLTPLGTPATASEKPHDSAVDMSDLSLDRLSLTRPDTHTHTNSTTTTTENNSSNSSSEDGTDMEKAIKPPTKQYMGLPPPSYVTALRKAGVDETEGRPRSNSSPCQLLPIVEMEDQAAFGV